MNPFGNSSKRISDSYPVQLVRRPAVLVTVLCLLLGSVFVAWRIRVRTTELQARAQAEARAVSADIELQFNQAISAVEVLQAIARPSEPVIPNFQKVAADLLASRPSVAALELLPGGVVSDAIPRAGNERAVGYNILKDPAHRLAVNSAMQKRTVTVAGPLRLWDGAPGIRVLAPLFHKGRDGREVFWGFVGGAVRIANVLTRAELQELGRKGYDYAVIATTPATQAPVRLAEFGNATLGNALHQPIHARDLEITLAVRPHRGWLNTAGMAVRFAGVLVLSAVVCGGILLWQKRSETQVALAAANTRYAQEVTRAGGLEQQIRAASDRAAAAEAEAKRTRTALDQAEAKAAELRSRLEHVQQQGRQALDAAEARAKQTETRAGELQSQLEILRDAGKKAAQASEAELERLQGQLEDARQTATQLENRLEKTVQEKKQVAAAAHAQQQQLQAAVADLQSRLDSASRAATETGLANTAQINRLRDENRELKARLQLAERRAEEISGRLEATKAELARQAEPASVRTAIEAAPAPVDAEPAAAAEASGDLPAAQAEPMPAAMETRDEETSVQPRDAVPEASAHVERASDTVSLSADPPAVDRPASTNLPLAEPQETFEPTPVRRPPRARKSHRQDQMDLFNAAAQLEIRSEEPVSDVPDPDLFPGEPESPEALDEVETVAEVELTSEEIAVSASSEGPEIVEESESRLEAKPHRAVSVHHGRPLSPGEIAELRKAVHQIVPLLADQDPGASDCLKDNRATFRSAFTTEGFEHFQQLVRGGDFTAGLEQLRKAIKRHGISA
jgi:hypothetical protein